WGPIEAAPPRRGWGPHARFLSDFFSRKGPELTREVENYWSCGNCLIDRARAGLMDPPFDPAQDELGGEDDRLFAGMRQHGARFGWAPPALAYEHVPETRARLSSVLARGFAFVQGPAQTAAEQRNWPALAGWMLVGAAQTFIYGLAAIALWLVFSPARAKMTGRAAQGLGKILWFDAFAPRFYGAAQMRAQTS